MRIEYNNYQNITQPTIDSFNEAIRRIREDDDKQIPLSPEEFKNLFQVIYKGIDTYFSMASNRKCDSNEDINKLYKYFLKNKETLIVRREDPEKVLGLIRDHKEININSSYSNSHPYPNCALFGGNTEDISGLKNALNEGYGEIGGVVTAIAFHKDEKRMSVFDVPDEDMSRGNYQRHSVKLFNGKIRLEDIAFIIVRVPNSLKPESNNKPEKDFYSFTGFIFNEDQISVDKFFNKKQEAVYYKRAS